MEVGVEETYIKSKNASTMNAGIMTVHHGQRIQLSIRILRVTTLNSEIARTDKPKQSKNQK